MATSHSQSNGVTKEVMTAAWAIALGAIAPMLDSTISRELLNNLIIHLIVL